MIFVSEVTPNQMLRLTEGNFGSRVFHLSKTQQETRLPLEYFLELIHNANRILVKFSEGIKVLGFPLGQHSDVSKCSVASVKQFKQCCLQYKPQAEHICSCHAKST